MSLFKPEDSSLKRFLLSRVKFAAIDYWRTQYRQNCFVNPRTPLKDRVPLKEVQTYNMVEMADPNWVPMEDMLDLKAMILRRVKEEKKIKALRGKNSKVAPERIISLASRRGNIPDPRHSGFPWWIA
jgi:hypothetical protein